MVQYAVPIQDDVITTWENTADTTTDLYTYIDNGIDGGSPGPVGSGIKGDNSPPAYSDNDVYVSKLTSLTDPESSSDHTLKYIIGAGGFWFGGNKPSVSVEIASGTGNGTVIASSSHEFEPGGSQVSGTFSLTLTAGEADSITDYSSLYFRTSGNTQGGSYQVYVWEAEFQVPDAGGGGGGDVEDPTNPEAFLMFL